MEKKQTNPEVNFNSCLPLIELLHFDTKVSYVYNKATLAGCLHEHKTKRQHLGLVCFLNSVMKTQHSV